MRYLRVGALAIVLLAGLAFHHTGATYNVIRVAYYVLIGAVIGYALYARSRATRRGHPYSGGIPAPGSPSTLPGQPGTALGQIQNPGWYPDQQDMKVQRYWDGSAWTSTRHWDGTQWVDG